MSTLVETQFLAVLSASDDALEDAIDLGASLLAASAAGWPEVSRAVLALYDRTADGCWRRGWQPADVVRMVGRELGERHLAVAGDLVAAQARSYPGTGRRWTTQLRDLDATAPWWSGDDAYLTELGAREGLDRFGTAARVLELLRLIARLPAIEPLAEASFQEPVRKQPVTGEPRQLGRIRALLAKAESSEFPEEAEAFTAKAQELMTRHSIDEALIGAQEGSRHAPAACRIGVDAPYDGAKALLLDAVADANGCQAIWSSTLGFSTVVGFDSDLDAVELLYTSLLVQATATMNRAGSRYHESGRSRRTKTFRQTFLIAYADRIRERLTAAKEEAVAAADEATDNRLLPVLAARDVAVQETTERMFPTKTTHRLRGRDADGWKYGKAAADRAELGHRDKIARGEQVAEPTRP
ncbi:DUF2786 domain-containing protein [Embleya sp. NBC_00896]|uniref:DUF2786 domain-containing protein n=1 Tax=Embleya sp. NBC_00896 TaxID=2975961 RepID=UPI003864A146|nr:DUF2786 domain-containing protein [Embleya sp. NBC_00896]